MLNPGGVRPDRPVITPGNPIARPSLPGGVTRPTFPNRPGGGNVITPGLPEGVTRPTFPNRPGGGDRPSILPERPGQGGGITRPPFPDRPGQGGGGRPGILPERPGQGGGGTQWPNRPGWTRPTWPGPGGGGTQWPNRPGWPNNRPGWGNWGQWGNGSQWNNWANRPGRWDNWNHWGPNFNTAIVNRGDYIRNTWVQNTTVNNINNFFTPNWYGTGFRNSWFWGYPAATSAYFWWNAATAASLTNWLGWGAVAQPIYYNYGDNVAYTGGTVYYDAQPIASGTAYAESALQLAQAGVQALTALAAQKSANAQNANAPPAGGPEWLPLGVFALCQDDKSDPTMLMQLAATKDGLIGGTLKNVATDQMSNVAGKIDKESQRAAWSTTDGDQNIVMEAGVFNLTQPQAPVLVHWGIEKTQTWLLVRLDPPQQNAK
jgi:hypothetical protein